MGAGVELTSELVDFLQSGVSILVGTRNTELRPLCALAMGAEVDRESGTLTLFLPKATATGTLENLRANGRIAVTFSRPIDHRSIQFKGKCSAVRESDAHDLAAQERYRVVFVEQLDAVGTSRARSMRVAFRPSVAIDVLLEEAYEQTPGPSAGCPVKART